MTPNKRLDSEPQRSSYIEVSLNLILDRFNINSFNLNIDTKEEVVRTNTDLLAEAKAMAEAIEKSEHNPKKLNYQSVSNPRASTNFTSNQGYNS